MEVGKIYKFRKTKEARSQVEQMLRNAPADSGITEEGVPFVDQVARIMSQYYKLHSKENSEGVIYYSFNTPSFLPDAWTLNSVRIGFSDSAEFDALFEVSDVSLADIVQDQLLEFQRLQMEARHRHEIINRRMEDDGLTWSDLIIEYIADDEKKHHVVNAMLEIFELSEVLKFHRDAGYSLERFLSMVDGMGDHVNYAMHHEDFCAVWGVDLLQLIESSDGGDGAIWDICVLIELGKLSYRDGLLMARDKLGIGQNVILEFYSAYFTHGREPHASELNQEQFEAAMVDCYGISTVDILKANES